MCEYISARARARSTQSSLPSAHKQQSEQITSVHICKHIQAHKMQAQRLISVVALMVLVACFAALTSAHLHKKHYNTVPLYQERGPQERCVCDCQPQQPVLPNKPYFGQGGYAQHPPARPQSSGYGNAGSFAVAGSYGSGGSQVSGGY